MDAGKGKMMVGEVRGCAGGRDARARARPSGGAGIVTEGEAGVDGGGRGGGLGRCRGRGEKESKVKDETEVAEALCPGQGETAAMAELAGRVGLGLDWTAGLVCVGGAAWVILQVPRGGARGRLAGGSCI